MSDVIDPNAIPIPKAEPDAVEEAGRALKKDGNGVAQTGNNIHNTWQGLSEHYVAPERDLLLTATKPVATAGEAFDGEVTTVGDALISFAGEVRPIITRLEGLKSSAQTFRNDIDGDDDWREDEDKVNEHNQLNNDVLAAIAQYQEAERSCANKITGVFGGTRFVPDGDHVGQGEKGYGLGEAPEDVETPWAKPQEHDKPWYQDAWDGAWDFGKGLVTDLGDLTGLHGQNGWIWEEDSHWGDNLKNNYMQVLRDAGGLIGLHGQNGWVWEEDSHFWSNLGHNWTEVAHSFVPWREWDDRPGYVVSSTILNVGSMFVGVGLVRAGVKLLKRSDVDAPDTRHGDTDGDGRLDSDTADLPNNNFDPNNNPTTRNLQNQLNDLDYDSADLQDLQHQMDQANDLESREPARVGGREENSETEEGSTGGDRESGRDAGTRDDDGPNNDTGTGTKPDTDGTPDSDADADSDSDADGTGDPQAETDPKSPNEPPNDPPRDDGPPGSGDPRDIPPGHFGDLDPTQPGPVGDKFRPGVYDPPPDNPAHRFEPHERDTADMRADEGKLVSRLPEHPLSGQGYRSLDAIERRGPDDPGTGVEYKAVGENTPTAFDDQLRRGLRKFKDQPDHTYNEGDIVIDGRPGGLSLDNAMGKLEGRLRGMLARDDVRLDRIGKIETYLGDGSKLIYQDGKITRFTNAGEQVIRHWDAEGKRWTSPR